MRLLKMELLVWSKFKCTLIFLTMDTFGGRVHNFSELYSGVDGVDVSLHFVDSR
jgi:hypothetical protein